MAAAIAHRGPDDEGFYFEPGLALGSRRLALVDPEHGRQPLTDPSGRFVVVANGELFSHAEERQRLEARGARFRTRCDTEVWTQAVALDGEAAFPAARGQFAVAVWDQRERRLMLARDRFGICPLYTAQADGWLLFASEIKGILAAGMLRAELDCRAVDHIFSCLCASPVRSPIAGITPLPPGHKLVAGSGSPAAVSRFAELEFPVMGQERRAPFARARAALTSELEHALAGAVARRLAADAPVAMYLSGGVDSSLLVALAAKQRAREVTAFSVRLVGLGHDESDLAAQTAQTLGVRHVTVTLDPAQVAALFPEVVIAAEVPILDHADACLLLLAQKVRARGFKAVLTGEGADENFAGYPWVSLLHGRAGALVRAGAAVLGAAIGGGRARLDASGPLSTTAAGRLYALFSRVRAFLYADSFFERLGSYSPADDHAWSPERVRSWHPLNQSLYADFECVLGGHLLADKGDRVAMAAGVEPRFPFLDEEVVALAASIDPALKLRHGQDKWLLRQVAARVLPAAVANRQKHMFRAEPIIHAPGRPAWTDELLSPESLRRTGLFEPTAIAAALAQRSGSALSPRTSLLQGGLTGVVSTQLFIHLFCGGGLCSLPVWSPPQIA